MSDPMSEPKTISIKYYAALREQAGRSEEQRSTSAGSALALYQELAQDYGFSLLEKQLKVAINSAYQPLSTELKSGDTIVFIPPVAGG